MPEDELNAALQSADLETRLAAVERAAVDPVRYAKRIVALIPQFPHEAYFILERIGRFGNEIVPHLLALAESNRDEHVRLIVTLGLAHFKQALDNTILINAIRNRSEYQYLACRALAWLRSDDFLPILLDELHVTSPVAEWDRLACLVSAIEELCGEIPTSERERLIATGPPLTKALLDAKTA